MKSIETAYNDNPDLLREMEKFGLISPSVGWYDDVLDVGFDVFEGGKYYFYEISTEYGAEEVVVPKEIPLDVANILADYTYLNVKLKETEGECLTFPSEECKERLETLKNELSYTERLLRRNRVIPMGCVPGEEVGSKDIDVICRFTLR